MRGLEITTAVLAGALALGVGAARAATVTIPAGSEMTLTGDIKLGVGDSFVAGDASGARCVIHGGGHKIATPVGKVWTGSFTMVNCDVDGLGIPRDAAIDLDGGMDVTI